MTVFLAKSGELGVASDSLDPAEVLGLGISVHIVGSQNNNHYHNNNNKSNDIPKSDRNHNRTAICT